MIQLLIEPSYGANLWAQAYLAGIREEARKRGWELQTLTEEAEAAEEPVLLVGSAVGWLKSRLARLAARNLPCLIAGVPPQGVRCGFARRITRKPRPSLPPVPRKDGRCSPCIRPQRRTR